MLYVMPTEGPFAASDSESKVEAQQLRTSHQHLRRAVKTEQRELLECQDQGSQVVLGPRWVTRRTKSGEWIGSPPRAKRRQ
jgi:hypothetical protein